MSSFKRSMAIGRTGENAVSNCLQNHGYECKRNEDKKNFSYYDLEFNLDSKRLTIEVKFDRMSSKTGNICVEYENTGKSESGINVTKSNFWCYVIQDDLNLVIFLTSVKRLKKFISENSPLKTIVMGGDKNSSFHLYKDSHILKIFERIDIMDSSDFTKFIKKLLRERV